MIDLVKAAYKKAVNEYRVAAQRAESETEILKEASMVVTDRPDRDGWASVFQSNDAEKGLVESNQLEMIRKARQFSRFDPNARAALTSLVNYIMGKGLSMTPKADDPMVWYVWREFCTAKRNKWSLKQFEIVGRSLRDGEIFIEFFDEDENKAKTGKATIRFIDPLLVRANTAAPAKSDSLNQTINNGVNTDAEDTEKVLSYSVQLRANANEFRTVQAERVIHIKLNVDSDQKRGETDLLSVMSMLKHYQQWIENRIILNKMRSAIVLVRSVEGTPSEVAGMAATIPSARNPSGETKRQNIRGGTILTAGHGVKYEMLSANINATDAKEDGRNIKTNIAAGMNMPEYIFGDASNQNYASSLIAESPFVKAVQYWQIFFEFWFAEIYRKVIEIAVAGGKLEAPSDEDFINELKAIRDLGEAFPYKKNASPKAPARPGQAPAKTNDPSEGDPTQEPVQGDVANPPEVDPRAARLAELMPNGKMETPTEVFFGCDMAWPEIVHRDMKQHVEALTIARQNGWVADQTACGALGYDYSEEVRKQKQTEEEATTNGNPLLGKELGDVGDDADMDAELQDMIAGLSPEEQQKVLQAKDPREVVRVLLKKQGAESGAEA